jgi:hypothetical protein
MTLFYLESRIWSDAISRWIRHKDKIKLCANLGKVQQRPWQSLDKSSGKNVYVVYGKPKPTETERRVKRKVKSMLIIFFDITKNLSWQVKLSIPHTTLTFYGDCVKMCEEFTPKFGDKRTGCCITTTYRLILPFSPGKFSPEKNMTSSPLILLAWLGPCDFSVSTIEDTTERQPFWHNWGNRGRTPSQNSTSSMHLKNGRGTGTGA